MRKGSKREDLVPLKVCLFSLILFIRDILEVADLLLFLLKMTPPFVQYNAFGAFKWISR